MLAPISLLVPWMGLVWSDPSPEPAPIMVDSVLITLIDQADAPARVAGVVSTLEVREGQLVNEGDVLATLDDRDVALAAQKAKLDWDISQKLAENDTQLRLARKSAEIAEAELKRATDALARFKKSVSRTELDLLQRGAERAALEVEQAEHDLAIARLTSELRHNEVLASALQVERRRVVSPLQGVVVQVKARRGEWLEPGETVLRIVRIDSLRAEGFVSAASVREVVAGAPVALRLVGEAEATPYLGAVIFVSPEVDPVNGQVRVWAEIKNTDMKLRPGLRATMVIHPATPRAVAKVKEASP